MIDLRRAGLPVCIACWLAIALSGCATRKLSWTSAEDASSKLTKGSCVAVICTEPTAGLFGRGSTQSPITNALIDELMRRNYRVTVLREEAFDVTLPTPSGHDAEKQPASRPRTGMTRRYDVAADNRADVLLEVSVDGTQKMEMKVSVNPIPFIPNKSEAEWKPQVRQVTMHLSDPKERCLLGSVTVRYPNATDKIEGVAKDLALGVDYIRNGKPSATLELAGEPGKEPPPEK